MESYQNFVMKCTKTQIEPITTANQNKMYTSTAILMSVDANFDDFDMMIS